MTNQPTLGELLARLYSGKGAGPAPSDQAPIEVTVERYDHQRGGDWPGNRGVVIDARSHRESTRVFSVAFPAVWIGDSNDVEMDEGRWPAGKFLAWLDAVRPHVVEAARRAASVKEG